MPGYIYENENGQFENVEQVSEGMWCRNCEFLEQPHNVMPDGCGSCGCNFESHISVKVVSNGNSSGTT